MIDVIEAGKKSEDWIKSDGQFIPYPATWLNGKRWEDEIQINDEPQLKQKGVDALGNPIMGA
jgi:hypothetical protein